jgi:hypothetical protein
MTNQNPASSQPQQPLLNSDLLAKLNAHADRSLDRLFTDIDELLSGDLESDSKSSQSNYPIESFRAESNSQPQHNRIYSTQSGSNTPSEDRSLPPLTATLDPAQPAKSQPKQQKKQQSLPLWLKALLGLGVTSVALSSLFFWLVSERKITIPKNIDTSWLPFQSQSQVSPEDAKFADYMRKSISKIETTASLPATTTTNLPNPADIALPTASAPIATAPAQIIATAPTTAKPSAIAKPIALVKTSQNGNSSTAIFKIDSKSQAIKIGQKIGTSNWSLVNIFKKEVTVKRKGGEIRSIKIGQKF